MEINIDLLVSGCNTRCRHCYVNGGPNANMPTEDVLLCIEKMDEIASLLPFEASFTLDNEPINHPDIVKIIKASTRTKHIKYYHHGMTTGIALLNRKDKDDIINAYLDLGHVDFGITIHGVHEHHDEIVQRKGAFSNSIAAARFLKSKGCKTEVSLMLNRFFAETRDEISKLFDSLKPDRIYFTIPIFTPHDRMMAFEPFRATFDTLYALRGYLSNWHQNENQIIEATESNSIDAAIDKFNSGLSLSDLFSKKQLELYMTVHANSMLYVGNTGAETMLLGDLRTLDAKNTAEKILALPGNRDYTFYDTKDLPSEDMLCEALKSLPENLLYGDFESVIYRALVEIGVPTKLLQTKSKHT